MTEARDGWGHWEAVLTLIQVEQFSVYELDFHIDFEESMLILKWKSENQVLGQEMMRAWIKAASKRGKK